MSGGFFRKVGKTLRLGRHPRYRGALALGIAGAIEHETILRSFASQHVLRVVDIGANVGQFALAVRVCIPEARVDSFEPLEHPAQRFEELFREDDLVKLHRYAVGPVAAEVDMHVSAAHDSSSLLPISGLQQRIFPGTGEIRRERVRVRPLDALLRSPAAAENAVLKIDVQGYELEALKGCEALLGSFFAVYVEASFVELYEGQALAHAVVDFLHNRGFMLSGVYNTAYDERGLAVQSDLLFFRRDG